LLRRDKKKAERKRVMEISSPAAQSFDVLPQDIRVVDTKKPIGSEEISAVPAVGPTKF
jgi:hypothetical protein